MHNSPSLAWAVMFGLAAASIFKLAVADRITRVARYGFVRLSRQAQRVPGLGLVFFHIEYAVGCALCAPFWISLGLWWLAIRDHFYWAQIAVFVMAARIVAYYFLRYFQETTMRDWPDPFSWPPPKRGKQGKVSNDD